LEVVEAFTKRGMKLLTAVNYTVGNLVNDPLQLLQRIVGTICGSTLATRKEAFLDLDDLKLFLMVKFDKHAVIEGDLCDTH